MRNQNLPPIKYTDGQSSLRGSGVKIQYRNAVVVEMKEYAEQLAREEDEKKLEEASEDVPPDCRMSFRSKEKRDEELFGPGLKGRTIADGDDL